MPRTECCETEYTVEQEEYVITWFPGPASVGLKVVPVIPGPLNAPPPAGGISAEEEELTQ